MIFLHSATHTTLITHQRAVAGECVRWAEEENPPTPQTSKIQHHWYRQISISNQRKDPTTPLSASPQLQIAHPTQALPRHIVHINMGVMGVEATVVIHPRSIISRVLVVEAGRG